MCFYFCTASKGFWAEMLGVGDFYYELGVQIIEICLATSHRNGGEHIGCIFFSPESRIVWFTKSQKFSLSVNCS